MNKGKLLVCKKSRMCVFSKRRYEEWKCYLLRENKVVLP